MTDKGGYAPKHSKLRGELAELRFMTRATEQGFQVIKPWGDSSRYDFVVETGGRFLRVQVKSTRSRQERHYNCALSRAKQQRYAANEIDFFAIYVVPIDTWYIIPFKAVCDVKHAISLSPHNSLSKQAPYREAWHLLREE